MQPRRFRFWGDIIGLLDMAVETAAAMIGSLDEVYERRHRQGIGFQLEEPSISTNLYNKTPSSL
jgi:hypothetical protein